MDWRIHFLRRVDSTNTVLRRLCNEGAPAGTIVLADYQSVGQGRHGRSWHTPPGTALLMSVLLRPNLVPERAPWMTMIAGLALTDAVRSICGLTSALKWPNDVMLRGADGVWRKCAGILQDGTIEDGVLSSVIVGMGLNVNVPAENLVFPDAPHSATSLLVECGRTTDRLALLADILDRLAEWLDRTDAGESPQPAWNQRLITLGRSVTVRGGVTVDGLAESTDEWGRLIVKDKDGRRHAVAAGDVTLRAEAAWTTD